MPERSRDWVWGAAGLAALIAVILVLAPPPSQLATDVRLSTLRTTPDGAGALFGMLEELGIPVDRRLTPLAGADEIRGPLAVLDPTEWLSPSEVDSLLSWVESGGRLILAAPPGHITDRLGVFVRAPSDSALEAASDHPWTANLGPLAAAHRVFRPDPRQDIRLEPLVVGPDGGPAVALLRRGAGEILLISRGSLLANGRIRASGLAPVIARAAADWTADGDTLRFDEYHHG
ncbi:MAG: DUF4350 domain-containing protein, partial [Gemmatimonadetes bacterium]|nr:DUF4350 domain-containing protein [Gemmatimonadota bacterium]NIQ52384.1 DUF4350 domain-containing protein [Gemmatimonadota bacterium]NIU72503.1 DUF4350 domain-containing protein [Gammaproteobacteria bacterium]NIX42935.1 DUF4350 domain-containing protein [Gemmatimonadota bacterium]NIY07116.1 DUF4350 domain-containing protein [Gemmatimonadota bacterium]